PSRPCAGRPGPGFPPRRPRESVPVRGGAMDPLIISAQFAAYTWYQGRAGGGPAAEEEALRYARANWFAFLPCAREGLGRLLLRIAEGRGGRPRRRTRRRPSAVGQRLSAVRRN